MTPPSDRRISWAAAAALALLSASVFWRAVGFPLRPWDHHMVLLLARCPQFSEGLASRLMHFNLDPNAGAVFFKILSMPLVWAIAKLAGVDPAAHLAVHLAVHTAACWVLFRVAWKLCGSAAVAFAAAAVFAVFSGHAETVAMPYFVYMPVAVSLAGMAVLAWLRHLETGRRGPLAAACALLFLAVLFYDAFLLLAVAFPVFAWVHGRGRRASVLAACLAVWISAFGAIALSSPLDGGGGPGRPRAVAEVARRKLSEAGGAARDAAETALSDPIVFLGGALPAYHRNGSILHWEASSVMALWLRSCGALALMLGGAWLASLGPACRLWGLAPAAAGAWLSWRSVPLAALAVLALSSRQGRGPWRAGGALLLAGLLCAFNISLGRKGGVSALRYHYVTAFFAMAAVAACLKGAASGGRPPLRKAAAGLLLACAALHARTSIRMLSDVRRDNAGVFAFRDMLDDHARARGAGTLFVPFSTALVQGPDWRGWPAQDIVFDLLSGARDPLTRHLHRAPYLYHAGRSGVVPNARHGQAPSRDFLFRFFLFRQPPAGRLELFGTAPREPRIAVEDGDFVFEASGEPAGNRLSWRVPLGIPAPLAVGFRRDGRTLRLVTVPYAVRGGEYVKTAGARTLSHALGEGEEFAGWESDNLALLGKDFVRVLERLCLQQTYVRIGSTGEEGF